MAHFAKLDENNVVTDVLVVANSDLLDSQGQEREELGIAFLVTLLGWPYWRQTSYNANFRKNYAGIGYKYDPARDAFVPPQPFASWALDEATCQWAAPVPYPEDGEVYAWDESLGQWV